MLIVISPAKTLDFESPLPTKKSTQPDLLERSAVLAERMRKLSKAKLAALMGLSDTLAAENVRRYKAWSRPFTPENARPAVFAFRGDVYQGLDADTLSAADLTWAQKRLRILSGLYGVLRPLDLMQPYRLEMGLPVSVGRGKGLYDFWGSTITDVINEALGASGSRVLVNLASKEYFGAIDPSAIDGEIVSPAFKERRDGKLKMISFSAKKARGLMARFIIDERVKKAEDLRGFSVEGYRFDRKGSTDDVPLFTRAQPRR
jgi:cytoplasmic iron level regulating protein YaaA (DUF328/UPF0246 family)